MAEARWRPPKSSIQLQAAFTNGPSMSVARAGHSATLFADGRVSHRGRRSKWHCGDSRCCGRHVDAPQAAMSIARSMHSAALLQDGRVLIVGGRDASGNELNSGEIFDTPAATFWTIGGDLGLLACVRTCAFCLMARCRSSAAATMDPWRFTIRLSRALALMLTCFRRLTLARVSRLTFSLRKRALHCSITVKRSAFRSVRPHDH